jgi:hypothetical protein
MKQVLVAAMMVALATGTTHAQSKPKSNPQIKPKPQPRAQDSPREAPGPGRARSPFEAEVMFLDLMSRRKAAEALGALRRMEKTKKITGLPDVAAVVALSPAQHLEMAEPLLAQARGERSVPADDIARRVQSRLELGREVIATGRASTRFLPGPFWFSHAATYIARRTGGTRAAEVKTQGHILLSYYGSTALNTGLLSRDRHFITEENRVAIDDITDAMAAAALVAYVSSEPVGEKPDLFPGTSDRIPKDVAKREGVRAQMRKTVLADPVLQGGDNIQRRFVAELFQILAIQSTVVITETVRTDSALFEAESELERAKRRANVRLIFKYATGLDLDRARLTDEGFVPAADQN